ncbi:MAG: TPM domain-containing protein [Isosphaeraceae bacterium]
MKRRLAFRTLALAVLVALAPGLARASGIRDQAELFDTNVLQRAERELDRLQTSTGLPVTIETVPSLKGESVEDVSMRLARQSGATGLFVLISKQEHKIDLRVSQHYSQALSDSRVRAIRESFIKDFKKGDYNAGLLSGVTAVEREAKSAAAANGGRLESSPRGRPNGRVIARAPAPAVNPRGGFGIGSLIGLGLLILAVLFVVRLVGSLMGGGAPMMGGPGPRMGMGGPGYGPGPGYGYGGGGGGGFWSSVFGGLGGAIAGNWIGTSVLGPAPRRIRPVHLVRPRLQPGGRLHA